MKRCIFNYDNFILRVVEFMSDPLKTKNETTQR